MKLLQVLFLLGVAVFAQELHPIDFDWKNVKNIWERPELQEAVKRLNPNATSNLSDRGIVGGANGVLGQFPFHVLLILSDNVNQYWCGGSLLAPHWVLTAAHCVDGIASAQVYSIINVNQGYYWTTGAVLAISHGGYNPVTIVNDIAMIKTATPASVTTYTNFISLPRNDMGNSFAGYTGIIQGFGRYSDASQNVSPVINYVTNPLMTNIECGLTWAIGASQVCQSGMGGRGACNGDSGGALFVGDTHTHSPARQQVGIVSYGAADGCELGHPVVFTRVTSFISWIDGVMANY